MMKHIYETPEVVVNEIVIDDIVTLSPTGIDYSESGIGDEIGFDDFLG